MSNNKHRVQIAPTQRIWAVQLDGVNHLDAESKEDAQSLADQLIKELDELEKLNG